MPRISQLSEVDAPAAADIMLLVDQSTGQTKKVALSDLLGIPDLGWTSAAETWTYSSYNSTLHTAVVSVPSDATTKYSVGMWVRFAQSTGGTKWGKITAITTTTLTIQMSGSATLANETITDNYYSPLAHPVGAPADNSFVYSYTNGGTGAGTFYFQNDGGIKRVWGAMTNVIGSTSPASHVLQFPTGFFSTAPSVTATIGPNTVNNHQTVNLGGGSNPSTSSVSMNPYSASTTTAEGMQIQAISYQ